jgi:hypothetical protein
MELAVKRTREELTEEGFDNSRKSISGQPSRIKSM